MLSAVEAAGIVRWLYCLAILPSIIVVVLDKEEDMKRVLTGICITAIVTFCAVMAMATTWNFSAEQPDGNYVTENIKIFAKDVEEATGGALKFRVHPAGSLIKRPDLKRGVQQGIVPIGDVFISVLGNEDPMYEIDSVPLLATSFDEAKILWQVSRQAISDRLEKQGILLLFAIPWPPQGLYTSKPIVTIDDFKGVRFRTYNALLGRLADLMGASPVTVNPTEIAQAFSTGIIEAMLTSPATGVDSQAWDFVRNYYDAKAFIPKNCVLVNARAFKKLPEAQQKAVLDAAVKAEERGWEVAIEKTDNLTAALAKHGMLVEPVPPAVNTSFKTIGNTILQEWLDKAGTDGRKVIDSYHKALGR